MLSSKLYRFGSLSKQSHSYKKYCFTKSDVKSFSLTSKLTTKEDSEEKPLYESENQLKRILSERRDPLSPFNGLIERLVTKPWISFFGQKTKNIAIKERKDTTPKKAETYRTAFDLPAFKEEEIQCLLSNGVLYIEAKKEELSSDGSKSWREFSWECPIPEEVNPKTVKASIDSDGLLLIEADLPQKSITGMKAILHSNKYQK